MNSWLYLVSYGIGFNPYSLFKKSFKCGYGVLLRKLCHDVFKEEKECLKDKEVEFIHVL